METDDDRTSSQRKARLSLLLRQREGEGERERLKEVLTQFPADEWQILSLSDSDVLSTEILSAVRTARTGGDLLPRGELPDTDFEEEFRRVLAVRPEREPLLIALSRVSQIGILEIKVGTLRSIARQLLDFDRDSMITTSKDVSFGMIAQRFEHTQSVIYELETWGSIQTSPQFE